MRDRGLRFVAVDLVPWAILVLLLGPFLVVWTRLPEPVAVHWGQAGVPNDSMSRVVALLLPVGLWVVIGGRTMVNAVRARGRHDHSLPLPPLVVLYVVGVVLVLSSGIIVWANLDKDSWIEAKQVEPGPFLGTLVACGVVAVVAGRIADARLRSPANTEMRRPSVALEDGETAAWFGSAHNYLLLAGLGVTSLLLWRGGVDGQAGYLLVALPIVLGAWFCWVRMEISSEAVAIGFGPWHWPRKIVRIIDIESAGAEHVQPLRYGGWGYRRCGSGCRAITVRRGDGMRLSMHDGRTLIVTIDDAEEGAGLINDLVARSKESG